LENIPELSTSNQIDQNDHKNTLNDFIKFDKIEATDNNPNDSIQATDNNPNDSIQAEEEDQNRIIKTDSKKTKNDKLKDKKKYNCNDYFCSILK